MQVVALCGHWAVLQTIAWAQMIRDYSRTTTIAAAITKTFNGRAPCDMCTKIAEERQREKSTPAAVKFEKKGEVFLVARRLYPEPPGGKDYTYFDLNGSRLAKRSYAPPAPVPKIS